MSAPEELSRAFAQGDLIVCVGPGPSREVGLPGLGRLAGALARHAAEIDDSVDVAALQRRIDAGRVSEVMQLASRTLGAAFQRQVEQRWSDDVASPPRLVTAIAERRESLRAVYSVSLDRLLERGFAGRWPSFATARPDLAQRRDHLWKVFGTLEMPGTWVLTQSQVQAELGPGSARRDTFSAAYRAHQMLFVGFAPDDVELEMLLELAPAAEEGHRPGHVIARPECSPADRTLLEGRGLQVVVADPVELFEALGEGSASATPVPSVETCPYVSGASLREEHAPLFFGRHAEVSEATSRLGPSRRWLSVEGAGGVGKSSFVHAGVIPALRSGFSDDDSARWLVAHVAGGTGHLRALTRALVEALELEDDAVLAEALGESGERFAKFLEVHVPRGAALVVVIDPLDRLLVDAPDDRAAVCDRLGAALRRGLLYLVTTLRSDRVSRAERDLGPLSSRLVGDAVRFPLRPVSRVGLREAVVEPAAAAGARIEPELVEQLVADADRGGGGGGDGPVRTDAPTLALVMRTLAGLWTREVIDDRVITLEEYRAMGGVRAAVRRAAQRVLDELDSEQSSRAKSLLAGLVEARGGIRIARRRIPIEEARGIGGDDVVDRLAEGATVLSIDEVGEVAIVHDTLAEDWSAMLAAGASTVAPAAVPAPRSRGWLALPVAAALAGVVGFFAWDRGASEEGSEPPKGPARGQVSGTPEPPEEDPDAGAPRDDAEEDGGPPDDPPEPVPPDAPPKKLDLGAPGDGEAADPAPDEEPDVVKAPSDGVGSAAPVKPPPKKKDCYFMASSKKKIAKPRPSDMDCEEAPTAKKKPGCKRMLYCVPRKKI